MLKLREMARSAIKKYKMQPLTLWQGRLPAMPAHLLYGVSPLHPSYLGVLLPAAWTNQL